ncbi:hypothetical protein [Cytophaga aurantiaca]|uniref:hypothetical protein n=1 Tax=Cytophaga aurantiaca TaxID=29530 RepID=UPI000368A1A4|nr:hypothetical protein [Cytophaga aurantiaca]
MIKKILSITSFVLGMAIAGQGQTVQDIFGKTNYTITWYGIDYSHSKIVGSVATFGGSTPISAADLRDNYYAAWNYLILDEPDKFDIAKMIHHKTVEKDISITKKLNAAAHMDSIEVAATPYYSPQEIQSFVSAYPIENKTGIGLVFITESMNKLKSEAYYHVVFFNATTKEVLLQERFRGGAAGMRIRNYWAGSYFSVMEYVKDSSYSKWRKKYAPNTPDPTTPTW